MCILFGMDAHKRIKKRREAIGMTQRMLASIMDKTITSVSTWERGAGLPRVEDLPQLSHLLNCSIDWLLTGKHFKPDTDGAPPPADEPAAKKKPVAGKRKAD